MTVVVAALGIIRVVFYGVATYLSCFQQHFNGLIMEPKRNNKLIFMSNIILVLKNVLLV